MRAIWEGSISFGLVNIPIKLYSAVQKKELKFRYLHKSCKTPLQYLKFCPNCKREVGADEIAFGYEYEKDKFVLLDDSDFSKVPIKTTKTIDIFNFIKLEEIDPIYFEKAYYLIPKEESLKAYALLQQALNFTNKVAIGKVVLRKKEKLVAIRPYSRVLLMETLYYHDEIRSLDNFDFNLMDAELRDEELKMAIELINALTIKFEPESYKDNYREALLDLIAAKIEGREVKEIKEEVEKAKDLMEALKISVELAKKKDAH